MLSYMIPFFILVLALACETQYRNECMMVDAPYDRIYSHKYNVIFALLLFAIAALRSPNTGADTGGYYSLYKNILSANLPLEHYFTDIIDGIRSGTYTDGQMWSLFEKIASYVIPNAQLWMAFVAGIFIFACYRLIKRYSLDPIISWVYVYSIYLFTFILQGFRQSIAMAIVMLSFKYADEKKPVKFLLMIGAAYLFHQSAIVCLAIYPLVRLKSSKLYFIPIFGGLVLAYITPSSIIPVLENLISETRFSSNYTFAGETLSIMGWVLLFLFFSFCFIFKDAAIKQNQVNEKLLTITMAGLVIQSFVSVLSEMFRVSYYFNMFNMVLVANTCACVSERNQKIVRYGFILAMMAYVFYSGVFQYKFFWQ